ncbi:MAG: hypothetical protein H6597_01300 [Flavobacteriales bacterium]|nr:hypothetical protein [Flavobacteriales bacterium]
MKGAGRWAVLWALLILVLCLIPGKDLPDWDWFDLFDLDKPVHFTLFGVQMVLTALAFHPQYVTPPVSSKRLLGPAFGACVAYGGLHGSDGGALADGRTADITDFIANTPGLPGRLVYLRRRAKRAGAPEGRTDPDLNRIPSIRCTGEQLHCIRWKAKSPEADLEKRKSEASLGIGLSLLLALTPWPSNGFTSDRSDNAMGNPCSTCWKRR